MLTLAVALFLLVSVETQNNVLSAVQHAALMKLYDALGALFALLFAFSVCAHLLTHVFLPACPLNATTTCPRFAANAPCANIASRLTCNSLGVRYMCVSSFFSLSLSLSSLFSLSIS